MFLGSYTHCREVRAANSFVDLTFCQAECWGSCDACLWRQLKQVIYFHSSYQPVITKRSSDNKHWWLKTMRRPEGLKATTHAVLSNLTPIFASYNIENTVSHSASYVLFETEIKSTPQHWGNSSLLCDSRVMLISKSCKFMLMTSI